MAISDSFEQALEFAKGALQGMTTNSVPPTPENFLVWYTHAAGRNPNLSHMISILTDNKQEITNTISEDLYSRFFTASVEDDALHETAERINEELKRIMDYVGEAGGDVSKYGETLSTAKGDISAANEQVGLKEVISRVLNETQKMEEINSKLEQKLNDSNSEVSQLREDLEDMRKEALTDSLTGIANRKMFDMELRHAARDAMENGEDLSLMMIDIDYFKKFNDTYGHQVG
ncbi:MAG: diguanylate cyclase, partial [Rhodospirillaceae bacterium]|nr:diguanylate cyclase [Rhodospirillaceae bacterium]